MSHTAPTQRDQLRSLFAANPLRRARELRETGIDAKTIARARADGEIEQISRGLYQRADADVDVSQSLAEASKRVPKGVIAMLSALAYHGLTDQMPRKVWIAIGRTDWVPVPGYPPLRVVRFSERYLGQGIEHHRIAGVPVPIYSIPKTLADLFRNPGLVDRSVAIEGLRAALDQRKASPAALTDAAKAGGAWKVMHPYIEALTSNG